LLASEVFQPAFFSLKLGVNSMFFRSTLVSLIITALVAFIPSVVSAHHNSPEEIQDFITDQLIEVDSPHLLSSDDDPSLLDVMVDGMEDVDYVVVIEDLTANEVTDVLEDILEQLSRENEVCDVAYVIDYDMETQTFTLTIYVDYCT
jgi:GTPase Era involved in 16S rRNA processing